MRAIHFVPKTEVRQTSVSVLQRTSVFGSLLLLFAALPVGSADRVFEVVPPEKAPFNYPAPPREGAPGYFPIAENGQARCVIVRPAGASSRLQAMAVALQSYLNLATGARIQVITDDAAVPGDLAAIHVGDTVVGRKVELNLPDLRYGEDSFPNLSGYLVKTLDRRTLVIRGPNEMAINNGLVGFLKRYVGIRQYWPSQPGNLGDVIPARPTLSVPEIEWRDWPYFFSTTFSARPFPGSARGSLDFYRRHQTLRCSENYDEWLPPKTYAQTHPEFYPLINGQRRIPSEKSGASQWQPCASNPQVVRIMGEAVSDYFRKNPQAAGINVAINDGGGDCTCPACQAMDAPDTDYSRRIGMSDRYVKLTNKICEAVGREFPGKWIIYLAYAAARPTPSTVKPHPRLLPVLTAPGNLFEAWDQWMKTGARHMGLYLHHDDTFFVLPKLDVHQMARRIRYAVASGRARVFYMEMHTQWPFADTVPCVTSELLWDPRQDVDALLKEYYTGFYGPAAAAMKTFYDTIEAGYERWLAQEGEPHWFGKDISSIRHGHAWEQFRVLTPEEAARASAALAQAAEAAAKDARIAQRVQVVRHMFPLQELGARHYGAVVRLRESPARSEADAPRVVADARAVFSLSREMRRYIEDTLEKPPANAFPLFKLTTRPSNILDEMKSGQPGPEALAAISAGLNTLADLLRARLGPEKAAAWWRAVRASEKEPALAAAFQSAEMRARGIELKNLVADAGFEDIGRQLAPDEFAQDRDVVLSPDQVTRIGIHQWFAERSPYRIGLAQTQAHSGRWSLMLEHCHRARFSRYAPAQPGTPYRVSLWFKQNEGAGAYKIEVRARSGDDSAVLASIPVSGKPGEWREFSTDIVTPPQAKLIMLWLYVNGQAAGARCWMDDVFIGCYPK